MTESRSEPASEGFKLYYYDPSFAAAVLFTIGFSVASIRHVHLIFQNRTWYFIPFLAGCLFETIGYAARAYSSKETPDWSLMPYIIQNLLILLGPTFYAASIYMVLGRLIQFLDAQNYSVVPIRWLTKIFLIGDVLSIFGQGGGGGILAGSQDQSGQDLGNKVILLGLGIQVIFFGAFMVVTAVFHIRISRRPTPKSQTTKARWQTFIKVLYLTSMLILVRSVFRMIEYAQGHDGSLIRKEVYVYVLDALLMILVAVIFAFYHPSSVLAQHKVLDSGEDLYESSDSYPMVGQHHFQRMS